MSDYNFPALLPSDIEVRVATCNENFMDLLLYKNARVDMRILDEVVGAMNWTRRHEVIDGVNYCTVSIYDDKKKEWISKQDCGTSGEFEKEKGSSSDAFKRACFCWGIGRELYTIPSIRLWNSDGLAKVQQKQDRNGKTRYVTYDTFAVTNIVVENHVVKELVVVNESNGKTVCRIDANSPAKQPESRQEATKGKKVDVEKNKAVLRLKQAVADYCERTGADVKKTTDGIKKRPEYEEAASYLNMVAEEFENGM